VNLKKKEKVFMSN